jgi:hypothetical protein
MKRGRPIKHGMSKTPEYHAYKDARQRCLNPNSPAWKSYGGRGIQFLFTSFIQFIQNIGLRPSRSYELDRIDNDGHYVVGNVRWVLAQPSSVNRRKQSSNTSGYRGVTFCKTKNRWRAYIRVNGVQHHLGYFATNILAAKAYNVAAQKYFNKYALLNP